MTRTEYVIVVGARCAGSPTAMLLARLGHRVLVVDRATFPSDTVSTHVLHPPAAAILRRWGLLEQVVATGCPPVRRYSFDFGPFTISGTPRSAEGLSAYAPRRTVLDKILVDAARQAGAEVREGCTVDSLLTEEGSVVGLRGRASGGKGFEARAAVVVGADGHNSFVARAVGSGVYNAKPVLQFAAYTYVRDLPLDGFEIFIRPDRGMAAVETNDGLTLVIVGWPAGEAAAYKRDVEGNFLATLDLVPEFAERFRRGTRVERFRTGGVPNQLRTPYGSGWLLLGDAGYVKDPITAQGIPDAFADAERAAKALHDVFAGRATFHDACRRAQDERDAHALPMLELTTQLATLAPPPPEMQTLLGAISADQSAMDDFVSVIAGSVSPLVFFSADNVGRLTSAATVRPAARG
jgi:2-polyprenyl-6-methoxyphenol hydroxylase-like FAD-dependent oxidoreductase